MYQKLAIATVSVLFAALTPVLAQAETVMEKVARTGVLTAGTSKDAIPFTVSPKK